MTDLGTRMTPTVFGVLPPWEQKGDKRMSTDRSLKRLIEMGLQGEGSIPSFRDALWNAWRRLYLNPDTCFPYGTPDKDGLFFVASRRKYAQAAAGGDLVTYSSGLKREEKYSRDFFNLKTLDVRDVSSGVSRKLFFISNEAPLLRPARGRLSGIQRIHADLVAAAGDGSFAVVEAKVDKKSADPPPSALLQAYAYAFFLACHLANRADDVLKHARKSLQKYHGNAGSAVPKPKPSRPVLYYVMAPRGYFERFRSTGKSDADELRRALARPLAPENADPSTDPKTPMNPVFGGFIISETSSYSDMKALSKAV